MPQQVCTTATLQCTFGVAPSVFNATPRPVLTSQMMAGVITDNIPLTNVPPFGMCSSPSNPSVAAATAAALGVLTPMPCVPVLPAPWTPGVPTVLIANTPALDNNCKLMCAWGGVISITFPGQVTHEIP
ncbi:DUF4280 domain-containing protein [Piscinibacter sp. Jin2]|uniref:DUF4280 domain-containing protein n=1 Tax=Aquariibacter lacus TaxID=2801332 RepID=A0A9X0XBC1_9BURK|nr:DUF4280 domain-containing protein [Piscinibacter lacus]MBL0718379.1 DUF4280 domain-containing protein [Piscinibacter lacus]